MLGPILTTKISIPPPRPTLVPRPRLTEQLTDGLAHPLTLVAAPAGFGKTTLLADFALRMTKSAASPSRFCWLSLDDADNDPTHFFACLVAALKALDAQLGDNALSALQARPPLPQAILTALINDLARAPEPLALVLDDYHLITAPPIHQALTFLIEHLPPHIHLVLSTRADPPLPTARLRARNQLTEIRAADLRFTPDEAAAFLNDVMGLNVTRAQVAALEQRTEGWVVGLQMAAISMRGHHDRATFIQAFTGSHRFVLDYLTEEVFQRQPETVQTFLLQTSILDQLSAPLCDAVTQRADGAQMLVELEHANLFLLPLDDERQWYRYHHLFADLLRARLRQTQSIPASGLHSRAAEWYEKNELMGEAVRHALAAQDSARAARLVEQNALPLLRRGELATLLGWLGALPAELVQAQPWLSVYYGWCLVLVGQLDAVEPQLLNAEGNMPSDAPPASKQALCGHIAAIRAYAAAFQQDVPRSRELAGHALKLLPEDDLTVRSVVTLTLAGACLLSDDLQGAHRAFTEACALGRRAGNIHVSVPALGSLAYLEVLQGRLHRAEVTLDEALRLATPRGPHADMLSGSEHEATPLPVAATAHLGIGDLQYEWNDLERAARHFTRAIELGKQWGNVSTLLHAYASEANLLCAQGNERGAREALRQVEPLLHEQGATFSASARAAAHIIRVWLALGDVAAAARVVEERDLKKDDAVLALRQCEYIALARLLAAQERWEHATALLARLHAAAAQAGCIGNLIEILLLQTAILDKHGDRAQARRTVARALQLGAPEGYVRTFVDEGATLKFSLSGFRFPILKEHPHLRAYTEKLLSAFPQSGAAQAIVSKIENEKLGKVEGAKSTTLVEPLSEREIQVLRLLAAGLSNQEIADKLIVAVGTVKAHTSSIYRKLDVTSRTQAVARGRDLNLI